MEIFKIESTGIYNSQIARPNINISAKREAAVFELELPLLEGGISYINSSSASITPHTVICAKPKQIRHTRFPFKCYYIHLSIQDEQLKSLAFQLPDFIEIKNQSIYSELFKDICRYYNTLTELDELMLQSLIFKLIYLLKKESTANSESRHCGNNSAVAKALKYINSNLTNDLSLEKVSEYVALSPIHFHNTFKYAIGKTLHEYVEDKRIKKSVALMQTTEMTLAEIAYTCGFSSQSYFSYAFKRKMNMTPRKYIQKINSNYEI